MRRAGCFCDHGEPVDADWVWDAIYETSEDTTRRLDIDGLRSQVDQWFSRESLSQLLGSPDNRTQEVAIDWLAKAGKRWRPFLAACAFKAVSQEKQSQLPKALQNVAVAVECFHKASLIHDDIEDGDSLRYGEKTLHEQFGVAAALNVGDLLLGEGYRLLAEMEGPAERKVKMLQVAAEGHRQLCLGQGEELFWVRKPGPLSVEEVISIFQRKTSPAFEVALKLGAIFAGGDERVGQILRQYSQALGVAYQIKDDIEDFQKPGDNDQNKLRPSLVVAVAYEIADGDERKVLKSLWGESAKGGNIQPEIQAVLAKPNIEKRALDMMESYKSEAIGVLACLDNASLKGLLRRVVGKIFNDVEVMGCCDEYQAGHAKGGEQSRDGTG